MQGDLRRRLPPPGDARADLRLDGRDAGQELQARTAHRRALASVSRPSGRAIESRWQRARFGGRRRDACRLRHCLRSLATAADTMTDVGPPWRQPDFVKLWLGQAVSGLGSQVTLLALPLIAILVLDHGPAAVPTLATL